ncbi:uncharacterized protein LOC143491035 isoform X2 [Brachyhypopomus gauderio]|uniref:uncharacterized protein LOC143491035 isoform X2 n=1 Tax=Brachyhypopomus gauderio TaxID=698409 RepID=UPI0040422EAD
MEHSLCETPARSMDWNVAEEEEPAMDTTPDTGARGGWPGTGGASYGGFPERGKGRRQAYGAASPYGNPGGGSRGPGRMVAARSAGRAASKRDTGRAAPRGSTGSAATKRATSRATPSASASRAAPGGERAEQVGGVPPSAASPAPGAFAPLQALPQVPMHDAENLAMWESEPMNVDLICIDPRTNFPKVFGKGSIKLLEILDKSPFTHQFNLKLNKWVICKLEANMIFTYGSFGYGYSHQVQTRADQDYKTPIPNNAR